MCEYKHLSVVLRCLFNMIKSKKFQFLIILTILIAGFVYSFSRKNEDSSKEIIISLREYILGSFLNELPEINKKLPHRIDDQTVLLSIKYENNKILSIYELGSSSIGGEFLDKIKPSIKKQACDDAMKKKLLEVDIDIVDRYQNPNGDMVFEIVLNKSICSKLQYNNQSLNEKKPAHWRAFFIVSFKTTVALR